MKGWGLMARALAGATALAMATAAVAQDGAIPRGEGYAQLERLPDFSGVWAPDWSLLFSGGAGGSVARQEFAAVGLVLNVADGIAIDDAQMCGPDGLVGWTARTARRQQRAVLAQIFGLDEKLGEGRMRVIVDGSGEGQLHIRGDFKLA